MNEITNKIIKLLTSPYKQKDEEWIARGVITSKIEQRIKNSKLRHVTSGISFFNNKRYLIYTIKITENIALYMYFISNEDSSKERFKFEGVYNLGKYTLLRNSDDKLENNIDKDYIMSYLQKNLIEKIKRNFISDLNNLLLDYEDLELEVIDKIKEILA